MAITTTDPKNEAYKADDSDVGALAHDSCDIDDYDFLIVILDSEYGEALLCVSASEELCFLRLCFDSLRSSVLRGVVCACV
ncbi:hypothetical protein AKJ16_DCAP10933 [Drosera capensis]